MRLKYVSLKGFKAYKDETKVFLHPGANAIVGSNGSGKSSLLEAVILVVSEVYGKRTADVKAYLHRGLRNSVLTAYVELCFDNCDRKIATIDKDEVRFRRIFHHSGAKKDELQVDGRKVTKAEFSSLLEAGGFSKSNPYYVIRQGKIMEMAEMTDEGRLKLLKDFSGVQIYEEKRALAAESLQNSMEVASQADEQMKDLEKRLAELEVQKAELIDYRRLVNSVEVYRLAINDLDASEFVKRLEKFADRLAIMSEETRGLRERLDNIFNSIDLTQIEQKQVWADIKQKELEISDLNSQLTSLREEYLSLELEVQAKVTEREKRETEAKRKQKLLADQRQIADDLKKRLATADAELIGLKARRSELVKEQLRVEAELQLVQDKKERCQRLKNNAARKAFLESEIRKLEQTVVSGRKELQRIQSELESHQKQSEGALLSQAEKELADIDSQRDKIQAQRMEIDQSRSELLEEQRRIQDELLASRPYANTQHTFMKAIDSLRSHVKDRTWRGLLSVLYWDASIEANDHYLRMDNIALMQHVVELSELLHRVNPDIDCDHWRRGFTIDTLKIPGVLGPLWSLIRVSDKFRTAVSVAINNQLENVVCMNDGLASSIASDLKRRRADETINLAPLNQIRRQYGTRHQQYPQGVYVPRPDEEVDLAVVKCVPLASVISVPAFLTPIVMQVSRKWLLVIDSDQGRALTNAGFDCVTLDGDKLTSKGTLQGGHITPFGLLHAAEELRGAFAQASLREQRKQEMIDRQEGVRRALGKVTEQKRHLDEAYDRLTNEKLLKRNVCTRLQSQHATLRATSDRLKVEANLLEQKIASASDAILQNRRILLSNKAEKMTAEDVTQIEALEASLDRASKAIVEVDNEIEQLSRQIEKSRRELHKVQEWIELNTAADETCSEDLTRECDHLRKRLSSLSSEKSEIEKAVQRVQQLIDDAQRSMENLRKNEEELRDQHEKASRQLLCLTQEVERLKTKDFELKQKIKMHEDNKATLLNTGQFTQADIDNLKANHSKEQLHELLTQGEKSLVECPRVNEKAIEDLADFQAEFAEKKVEQEQLRKSLESVIELMRVLDERRSQTLRMSFDLVNTNLQKVFASLVPGGRAKLVIKKLSDDKVAELMTSPNNQRALEDGSVESKSLSSQLPSPASDSQASAYKVRVSDSQPTLNTGGRDPQWDEIARGIEIKASFRSTESEQTHFFPIVALSGGQKTILALSLIFAMQRCDQAPFYIFDECDAALDEGYRASVAKLIHAATINSQFLITTFRRELCEMCDQHFMVVSSDRVAQVKSVTKQEALEVIMREQQASETSPLMIDA